MAKTQNHRPGARVPIRVVLPVLLLLIGGGVWLIWRAQFADQAAKFSIVSAPNDSQAPNLPVPVSATPTRPSTETIPQQRSRLGIAFRHLALTAVPDGLKYSVSVRLVGDRIDLEAFKSQAGVRLLVTCTPMSPGGSGDDDTALIRRGVELASRSSGAEQRLQINPQQFYALVAAVMPGHRPRALASTNPDGSTDPFAAHMSDFFQKWNASDAVDKKAIEADWLAALQQEGGLQLQQLDLAVAGKFDSCIKALTDAQKAILMELARANPSTLPFVQPSGGAPLAAGVHVTEELVAASGKLIASCAINDAATPACDFQPRVPPETSAQWIRTDQAVSELLRNDKLAKDLGVTQGQLDQLQSLPPRLPSAIPLADADRQTLVNALTDYCNSIAPDRDGKGAALMQAVREVGDRAYPPFMQEQTRRDAAIEFILTANQLTRLEALFKDSVSVK